MSSSNSSTTTVVNGGASSSKRFKLLPLVPPLNIPQGHVVIRILCHASRVSGVIGKSGSIVKHLQLLSNSQIRVLPPSSPSDHRLILVIASPSISRKMTFHATTTNNNNISNIGDNNNEGVGDVVEVSAAQDGVVRVFERIIGVTAERGTVGVKLLVEKSQVGALIGKGGKVIDNIRNQTGCKIKLLREKLPPCALPNDEMVEIEGDFLAVKRALVAVCSRLQGFLPLDKSRMVRSRHPEGVPRVPDLHTDLPLRQSSIMSPMPTSSANYASGARSLSSEVDRVPNMSARTAQQEVVFRILCSNDKVGGVIGKGGSIVKTIESETGASISVGTPLADCDERIITVTAVENVESGYSPAQNAVIRVFNRLDSGTMGPSVTARLVVPSNQVGCLLGTGGTIISELRKVTGSGIRIIVGNQLPKCAVENSEVVEITGEFLNVQDALFNVTGKLRENVLPNKTLNGPGTRSSSSVITEHSPYGRVRDAPSRGMHQSVGAPHSPDQHTTLTQSMDHFGISHILDRPPSPRLLASQTVANPRSVVDVGRGLTSVKGGAELSSSGSRSAIIITNTTVEFKVPENVIGSIYGENGSNLACIRKISGAKVVVHEPHPGTTDGIVVISGTPDENQKAQSLLQAFIHTRPS